MCSHTPRFSYGCSETAICTCPTGASDGRSAGDGRVYGPRWVPGWVYRVGRGRGNTGTQPALLGERLVTAKRAPEAPTRGWSGWSLSSGARTAPGPPLRGPVGTPAGSLPVLALFSPGPASWPIRARFDLISYILSQNGQVSPKYVEKASISPCFQNWVQKSPLEILGFPYSGAFSHKELMGLFDPVDHVYCQNDEVSPVCTPIGHAKGAVRYPHG